ncbi:ornithine cyclodeaminase family protein [Roseinatronobacter sp. NSM]|uniref:ornithine cyclodeaminase family protein n=1 Tax=Roseinatronobacter sp. NSM TaxID=3457785 RepID=UPI0040374FB4
MTFPIISADIEPQLNWLELIAAMERGHRLPKAEITDSFLYRRGDTLLSRAAWIDGLGALVKTATIFPDNPMQGLPSVNGGVSLYSDTDGTLQASVDFHLVTKWKTAGDSALAARHLARPESRKITLVGAGAVARSMYSAYRAVFPDAEFTIWSRRFSAATELAGALTGATATEDLQRAVTQADIICTATMSTTPVIRGEWLCPGQHLDLIGAYRADMREVDDTALQRAALFVDSRDTTLDHIGELKDPLSRGVINPNDVLADYYDIDSSLFSRPSNEAITICKNGGGAHLDLMTSRYILSKWYDYTSQP